MAVENYAPNRGADGGGESGGISERMERRLKAGHGCWQWWRI